MQNEAHELFMNLGLRAKLRDRKQATLGLRAKLRERSKRSRTKLWDRRNKRTKAKLRGGKNKVYNLGTGLIL